LNPGKLKFHPDSTPYRFSRFFRLDSKAT
jgi:hypothetical protein